jgi:hypothetical protein
MFRRMGVPTKSVAVYVILLGWTAWIGIPLY